MKKKVLTTAPVLLLVISVVAGVQFVNLASANMLPHNPDESLPVVSIMNPLGNITYDVGSVLLFFSVKPPSSWVEWGGSLREVHYILDGEDSGNIMNSMYGSLEEIIFYHKNLTGLSDGEHSLTISAWGYRDWDWSSSGGWNWATNSNWSSLMSVDNQFSPVYFSVDTTPPSILILSPKNKTYDVTEISLDFTISETTSWSTYDLDKQGNVTIGGNTTLTGLSYGTHSLTFYANDTVGKIGKSETIYFTIAQATESQQTGLLGSALPLEYGYAIIAVIGVAVVSTASYLLLKRQKNR